MKGARFKFIFKLRLEEFLALILLIPMLFFMVIYCNKEGFRASNVDRFLITGLVFFAFSRHYQAQGFKTAVKVQNGTTTQNHS